MPVSARLCVGKNVTGDGCGPEYVEIVHLTQQVLQFFEVVAPELVLFRQEVFDDVAEALDADAQAVESGLRAIAQGTGVEGASLGPTLKGQMFEKRAAGAEV